MAIEPVWCPVLHANVTRVTNLEGETTAVICPEYLEPTAGCNLKAVVRAGGPLSRLLERVATDSLANDSPRCDLR
jgi:hypothetical protein